MFEVHRLNVIGMEKAERLRMVFESALWEIEDICTVTSGDERANAREIAIVRTKLQEASFFAKRAMALCPENQE